jgi:hypothetical protein
MPEVCNVLGLPQIKDESNESYALRNLVDLKITSWPLQALATASKLVT